MTLHFGSVFSVQLQQMFPFWGFFFLFFLGRTIWKKSQHERRASAGNRVGHILAPCRTAPILIQSGARALTGTYQLLTSDFTVQLRLTNHSLACVLWNMTLVLIRSPVVPVQDSKKKTKKKPQPQLKLNFLCTESRCNLLFYVLGRPPASYLEGQGKRNEQDRI